jgi:FHS family L-fucose permease-like MFS transporter
MGIPAGILLQRVGYKKTALIAIVVGLAGVFIQFLSGHAGQSSAFGIYLLGAFIAGFSMCMLNTVVNPMLNTLGGGGNKGNQLIQIGGSFNSVMATFTPAFVGILIGEAAKATIKDVFPVMYIAMGVFALVGIVLWAVSIPEPHAERSSEPLGNLMAGALKFRHFVLGAVGIFIYVGVEVGTPYIAQFWLSDLSTVGAVTAGSVAGTYWFLMLIGRLCGAYIGGKVSSRTMLTVASSVAMFFVLLAIFLPTTSLVSLPLFQKSAAGALSFGLAKVPINAMFLILVGLCTSIMWGGIYNLAVEGLGKYVAVASGLFMVMVCGGGILPWLQANVADLAGYIPSYWVMFAGFAYLLFYAIVGSKNVNKDISVD